MPKYKIYYNFDGAGQVTLEADSKAEAEQLFDEGFWDLESDKETGSNYEITEVETIDNKSK